MHKYSTYSTRFSWIAFVATLLVFSSGGGTSRAQAPVQANSNPAVGVVRGDGGFFPLASMEKGTWVTLRAFSSIGERSVYKLVDADRLPREGWTYVPSDSGVPRPLGIVDGITTDAYCARQEGFTTNAPPPIQKLGERHLMAGIAIRGDLSPVRIGDMVRQPDASGTRMTRFVVQLTNALETENASPQQIPLNQRDRVTVQVSTLARDRVGDGGAHGYVDYYYFEAHKHYRNVESYASGWLVSSQGSLSVVSTTGGLDRGGESSRQRGRVLGVMRLRRSSVWVMEMRGYEGVDYVIMDPATGQALNLSGGGC